MLKKTFIILILFSFATPCFAKQVTRKTPDPLRIPYSPKGRRVRAYPVKTPGSEQTPKPTSTNSKKKEEAEKPLKKGMIKITFTEGDIKELIKEFSELLQKNFTYEDTIRGKITLIGPKEVSKWEAKKIFETALLQMGYAVIWGWPINKVVPVSKAKTQGNVRVIY